MASRRKGAAGSYAVRDEIAKQLGVIGIVAALGIWQHHFVIQAASADVYLFALLFGAGGFGIYNAVSGTHCLANEFTALEAMKEVYEDALWIKRAGADAIDAQFRRIEKPAIVYHTPNVLATAHNLIVEEVQRNGSFRIPTGTMQVLVADVETKLDDRQAMSHYLGALMVLLGLLGTFIGLMHTLESVGGILGSLDLSGNAGAGAIASLIESLKRPLEGMSTGFGASLFGLIGSLIIGFLSKVDAKAANRLKHEFETWIRGTVQIEGTQAGKDVAAAAAAAGSTAGEVSSSELNSRTLLRVARSTVLSTSRLAEQTSALATSVGATQQELLRQQASLDRLVEQAGRSHAVLEATERHILALAQNVATSQLAFAKLTERMSHLFDVQQRTNDALAAGQTRDAQALRNTIDEAVAGLRDINGVAATLETRVAAIATPPQSPPPTASASEAAALVADLDHLITVSRLRPQDIHNLRRLSAYLVDPDGKADDDPLRAREALAS